MRLFVALEISEEIRESIGALTGELKTLDDSWKWTRAENLHITLKFLGEVPQEKLDAILTALGGVPFAQPLSLRFAGLGFFPNQRRRRVLWVGIDGPPELPELAVNIETTLTGVGIPKEDRGFTPHLTLARSKDGHLAPKLRDALSARSHHDFGTLAAAEFHLIRSTLKSTGAEYTTLASFSYSEKTAWPH